MEDGPMRDGLPEPAVGDIVTADGKVARKGSRVFNYYDRKWGTINEDPDDDGWFIVAHDDKSRALLNGERIATEEPAWMKQAGS